MHGEACVGDRKWHSGSLAKPLHEPLKAERLIGPPRSETNTNASEGFSRRNLRSARIQRLGSNARASSKFVSNHMCWGQLADAVAQFDLDRRVRDTKPASEFVTDLSDEGVSWGTPRHH